MGVNAHIWTATDDGLWYAYNVVIYHSGAIRLGHDEESVEGEKFSLNSVRCVMD